jgi:hypothetical protein
MKKTLILALAVLTGGVLSATSPSLAWTQRHSVHHQRMYNYVPRGDYPDRGGSGPRVQGGSGMGTGAER